MPNSIKSTNKCMSGLLCGLLLVLLVGCSGEQSLPEADRQAGGLQLSVLAESMLSGLPEHGLRLAERRESGHLLVDVLADEEIGLQALYLSLGYDPRRLSPLSATAGDGLAGRTLELAVLTEPGRAIFGQVQPRWQDSPALEVRGRVATFAFEERPFAKPRLASVPPNDNASRTTLSHNTQSGAFEWRYYSSGDYDQNSLVTISDLTPLGRYIGESGNFDENTVLGVVDGDNNNEINISDVTPIGANFGKRALAYNFYRSAIEADYPAGNSSISTIAALGSLSFDSALGDPGAERIYFSYSAPGAADGNWHWLRPTDGEAEGTPSNNLFVQATVQNIPPTALLTADPMTGEAPLNVSFSAAGSSDSDGSIALYEFDFTGVADGLFYIGNGTNPLAQFNYSQPGSYNPILRVTDNLGASSTHSLSITVEGGGIPTGTWHIQDIEADAFPETWLMDCGGRPGITYFSDSRPGTPLVFIRAQDAQGDDWGQPQVVSDDIAGYCEMRTIGGIPMGIGYGSFPAGIGFVRANNPEGSSWSAAENILTPNVYVDQISFADVGGRPAVAYHNGIVTDDGLYYLRADDDLGNSWNGEPEFVGFYGGIADLDYIGGRPAVVFDGPDQELMYCRANDAVGSSWPAPVEVTASYVGYYPMLREINGLPGIMHSNGDSGRPEFILGGSLAGPVWTMPLVLSTEGGLTALEIFGGFPAAAWSGVEGDLEVAFAEDAAGSSWQDNETVDGDAVVIGTPGMVEIDGVPMLAYVDLAANNFVLKFAALY